jgi:hypothetical protein
MRDRLANAAERGDALRGEESRRRVCIVRVRALPRPRAAREGRVVAVPLLLSVVSVERLSVLRLRGAGLARVCLLVPLVVYESATELPLLLDVLGLSDRAIALPSLPCLVRRGAGVVGSGDAMFAARVFVFVLWSRRGIPQRHQQSAASTCVAKTQGPGSLPLPWHGRRQWPVLLACESGLMMPAEATP